MQAVSCVSIKIAVQRARKMRDRVLISAYVIAEAGLVKAVDATEN